MVKKKANLRERVHNLVVIEIDGEQRRIPNKPHLIVLRTQRDPQTVFKDFVAGKRPRWIRGMPKALRQELVPDYKPTTKLEVARLRLKNLKEELARQGYAINGDARTWRIYVLDIDADVPPPIPINKRGKIGKVVYVGQTSATLSRRLAQHRGEETSKKGRYIGSTKVKGRNPRLNEALTPSKLLFTLDEAKKYETETHQRLRARGYGVRGDGLTDSAKRRRNESAT